MTPDDVTDRLPEPRGTPQPVTIRPLARRDYAAVGEILDQWLAPFARQNDPAGRRKELIAETLDGAGNRTYLVAEALDGGVVGIMGLQSDDIAAELFEPSERPVEIITAYVRRSHLGRGVGRALAEEIERLARARGFTTLLVVSGARNRESGYPFWNARYGRPVRWDDDYFAPGAERVVWRMAL